MFPTYLTSERHLFDNLFKPVPPRARPYGKFKRNRGGVGVVVFVQAVIRSSITFDGLLMVNGSFETNAEHVYAAGPAAKFVDDGRFAALEHVNYDSVEVGSRAADVLMELLAVRGGPSIVAQFVRPRSVWCRLPGRCNYLHTAVAGLTADTAVTATTLSTGNADGYFEILVDGDGDVLRLSCYSKRVSHRRSR